MTAVKVRGEGQKLPRRHPIAALAATTLLAAGLSVTGLAGTPSAAAHDYSLGSLRIEAPWARATPPGAKVAGGYMRIENSGAEPDRLVGGTAPFAGRVEIHEMSMDGGIMKMRELAGGLEIPPGGSVTLEPGGYHVMFMELAEPLVEGESEAATLTFEKAGTVEVEFVVEGLGARSSGHGGHSHGDHGQGNHGDGATN